MFKLKKKKKLTQQFGSKGLKSIGGKGSSNAKQTSSLSPDIKVLTKDVPQLVVKFIEAIKTAKPKGIGSKGLFRHVPVDERANIKIVKSTLAAQGQLANLDQYSALVLAHVFKRYLQSFPEPLTTHRLYDSFILATFIVDENAKLDALRESFHSLPAGFKATSQIVLSFLSLVAQSSALNGMDSVRLGEMFATTFFRPSESVYYMRDDHDKIARLTTLLIEQHRVIFRSTLGLGIQRQHSGSLAGHEMISDAYSTSTVRHRHTGVETLLPVPLPGADDAAHLYPRNTPSSDYEAPSSLQPTAAHAVGGRRSRAGSTSADAAATGSSSSRAGGSSWHVAAPRTPDAAAAGTETRATRSHSTVSSTGSSKSSGRHHHHHHHHGKSSTTSNNGNDEADDADDDDHLLRKRTSSKKRRKKVHNDKSADAVPRDGTVSADASIDEESASNNDGDGDQTSASTSSSLKQQQQQQQQQPQAQQQTHQLKNHPLSPRSEPSSPQDPANVEFGEPAAPLWVTLGLRGLSQDIEIAWDDTLQSLLSRASSSFCVPLRDVRVVNNETDELIGLLSHSAKAPHATHRGMLDEGLSFAYECVPTADALLSSSSSRSVGSAAAARLAAAEEMGDTTAAATTTSNNKDDDDADADDSASETDIGATLQAHIQTQVARIKEAVESATSLGDAIELSAAVRDSVKHLNSVLAAQHVDGDTLRSFKLDHPRPALTRDVSSRAADTLPHELRVELDELCDIVLPLLDQLLDLSKFIQLSDRDDVVEILSHVDQILGQSLASDK